jgi:hypothetical protein
MDDTSTQSGSSACKKHISTSYAIETLEISEAFLYFFEIFLEGKFRFVIYVSSGSLIDFYVC